MHNDPIDCPESTQIPQEHNFDFSGGGDVFSNNQNRCIAALVKYLNQNTDGSDLVIAVNQPGDPSNKQEQPPVGVGATLSGKFIRPTVKNNLGIGATGWFDAPGNGRDLAHVVRGTFSAVGVPGWTTGGVSSMPADPGSWDPRGAGRLHAYIAVDNQARYAPLASSLADQAHSPLAKVLTQAATDWPAMTEGEAKAFSAIGQKALLTADPRTFYYTAPDTQNWSAKLSYVGSLEYHDLDKLQTSPPFSEADFAAAKKELQQELFWITQVDTYVRTLAEPYEVAQGTLWANVGKVASTIVNTDTSNGSGEKAFAIARNVVESVVDLIPEPGAC